MRPAPLPRKNGAAILCLDDENIQQILPDVKRRAITYGTSTQADLRIGDVLAIINNDPANLACLVSSGMRHRLRS